MTAAAASVEAAPAPETLEPVEPPLVVTPLLGLALSAARDALDAAEQLCRLHGDVPPARPGGWTGACDSCEQPARVRKALALLRAAAGEDPPPRRYRVDTTAAPCRVSGLFPVIGPGGRPVRLFAPGDAAMAAKVIARELEARGELGPFDLIITVGAAP